MRRDTVIPYYHCPRRPLDSALQILAKRNMVVQELKQIVTLLLLEPNDISRKLGVNVDCLLTSDGMRADDRMDVAHGVAANNAALREGALSLLIAGVHGLEAEEAFPKRWAQSIVGFGLVDEQRVPTRFGHVQGIQERRTRRLLLVLHVAGISENLVDG